MVRSIHTEYRTGLNPLSFTPQTSSDRPDPFEVSINLKSKRKPIAIDAQVFVENGPTPLVRWGMPLLPATIRLNNIDNGEYKVFAKGVKTPNAVWHPMPENPEMICEFKARGVAFVATQFPSRVIQKLHAILKDPEEHPKFLAGVEESENIEGLPPKGAEQTRVINWQRNDRIQYLSEVRTFQVANGFTYVQTTIHEEDLLDRYRQAFQRSYLPSDHIQFWGNIQLLQVVDGVAIVMEMQARSSNIGAPTCGIAADSGLLNVLAGLGITDDPKRAVKQRIEDRLETLLKLARG